MPNPNMPPLLLLLLPLLPFLLSLINPTRSISSTSPPPPPQQHSSSDDHISATLRTALSDALRLSPLLSSYTILDKKEGALRDCRELHLLTLSSLRLASSLLSRNLTTLLRLHLSAALSNREACLDGLRDTSDPSLVAAISAAYAPISQSLSTIPTHPGTDEPQFQLTEDHHAHREEVVVTVAKDGSGNFTEIGKAVTWVPSNDHTITVVIKVKAGIYEENVEVGSDKLNVFLVGEGSGVTIIRGKRGAADGWTTYRSATFGISAQGFAARDITFENVAGASKGQAVALRVSADMASFYRCTISGYQDTLYVHSYRQFYRECVISGTIDFIFGYAAAVLEACTIVPRLRLHGKANVVTAHAREHENEPTGISIHRCSVVPSKEMAADPGATKAYLGRPWKPFSRTVVVKTYLGSVVDPAGWSRWSGDFALKTLYYGEYGNVGPGAPTKERVSWPGFHKMSHQEASGFTVKRFIQGDQWLPASIPYYDGV